MPVSEKQKMHSKKWDKENMKVVSCKLRKEKVDLFRKYCNDRGTTPSAVIHACVDEYIAKCESGEI